MAGEAGEVERPGGQGLEVAGPGARGRRLKCHKAMDQGSHMAG